MTAASWPPRHLTDAPTANSEGLRVAEFVEKFCTITKDSVAGATGQPIVLRPWQRSLVDGLFARRPNGRRKHRSALIGMPRKNGKSALGAGIALYGLIAEGDGAEVYSCAGDREQARIVFTMARRMIEADPDLSGVAKLYRDAIEIPGTGSIYRVLSAEAYTKEGLSPTLVVFDELHVQPNDELWDVMTLGSGARRDPLVLGITTAGVRTDTLGRDSLCYRLYQHGQRVASGEVDDPTFFFAWWEPSAGTACDHRDPAVWAESNPGYDDLIDSEDFASTVVRTSEAEFRTKRTNVFVVSSQAALPHGAWDSLADTERVVAPQTDVVLMCDGSWTGDSTVVVGATVEATPHLFLVGAWERPLGDPDWRVPMGDVKQANLDAARKYRVLEDNWDPYRWQQMMQDLTDEGLPVAEFLTTSVEKMCKAWATFHDAVLDGGLTHDGNPLLARHVENMRLKIDAKGARPVKEQRMSGRHMDAGICAVGALSRALWWGSNAPATSRQADFYLI